MAFYTFAKLFSLAALAAVVNADTYWIFGGSRPIVTTRLDPVVSPGQVNALIVTLGRVGC